MWPSVTGFFYLAKRFPVSSMSVHVLIFHSFYGWIMCVWVTQSCPTLVIPWTVACQSPLSMGFSRQEYWSGLSFSPPGDFPNPRNRTQVSHIAGGLFTDWATGEATWMNNIPLYWYTICCLLISWVDICLGCFLLFWLLWILLQWTFMHSFFFIYYFWLRWVLVALCGLFSSCSEWGIPSSCGVWASRCSGFSCEARALECVGFSSCASWALAQAQ